MTHEEKAREIVENKEIWYWLRGHLCIEKEGDRIINLAKLLISEALDAAEKKGREEGSLSHTMTYHQGKKEGWNEAIDAAVKVAEDEAECERPNACFKGLCGECKPCKIAKKLSALKRGG